MKQIPARVRMGSSICCFTLETHLQEVHMNRQDNFDGSRAWADFEAALNENGGQAAINSVQLYLIQLQSRGALERAEIFRRRAIERLGSALGHNHPSALSLTLELGMSLLAQSRLKEVERMYSQSLTALDGETPYSVYFSNELGVVYALRGKLCEAENMFNQALQKSFEILECPEADKTWRYCAAINLSDVCEAQGRASYAHIILRQIGRKSVFETTQDLVAGTLSTLSTMYIGYVHAGRLNEARKSCAMALAAYEQALGASHSRTIRVVLDLASIRKKQGRPGDCDALITRAVHGIQRLSIGPRSARRGSRSDSQCGTTPDSNSRAGAQVNSIDVEDTKGAITAAYSLSSFYVAEGKYKKAEALSSVGRNLRDVLVKERLRTSKLPRRNSI